MYTVIFGGTFNPFHIGHYEILKALDSDPQVEKILLMPDRLPPHKTSEFLIDDETRTQMCRIASEDFPKCQLCLIEFEREGKSYTVDTVTLLKERYPNRNFAFAMGGDMFVYFKKWRKYEELIKMLSFFVFKRSATDTREFDKVFEELTAEGMKIILKDEVIPAVSSTELRRNFEKSKDLLPEKVYYYLKDRGVYCEKTDIQDYKEILKNRLNDHRYYHSLCVADEAERLAHLYGGNAEKCYLAGLLHDITKNSDRQEHLHFFETFGIMLSDVEKNAEKLWHAMSGSGYLKNILKIDDEEILDAVRYHTTAKANMSLTAKILYLADFTSKDRDYTDVNVIRALVDKSLDEAFLYALKYSIIDLTEHSRAIHPDTVEAFNQSVLKLEDI